VRKGLLLRKVWGYLGVFLFAGAIIGLGVYIKYKPEWIIRTDIRDFNRGVSTYQELLWGPLISDEKMLVSVYPHVIERAGAYFEKAGLEGTDLKVKSLCFYNTGTMIGRLAFFSEGLPGNRQWIESEITHAVTKLRQAIRYDPRNEDAKFNLELFERMLAAEAKEKAGRGRGYAPGVVDKGV
jgi:hypothetical protein